MSAAKSPVGTVPSAYTGQERSYPPTNYFPQQQPQLQQSNAPAGGADAETLSNTLANSQVEYEGQIVAPIATRPTKFNEEWDASQRGSSIVESTNNTNMHRSSSYAGSVIGVTGDGTASLSRGNTLKKKASLRRSVSLKRSGSRRSMKAGSVRSLALQPTTDQDELHSAFYCPVPTSGNPTEVLANRFQAWRKILKDLITYFREIQSHYEHRAKSLIKLGNVLNNISTPPGFLASGGLDDALQILRGHNRQAIIEANKAREIEEDVILALTGLRSDLHQKIKEIKGLAGDFKSSVDKEMEATRRAVNHLQEVLGQTELDTSLTTGKQDPYLLRLAVDRQLERQIDEENYLHQAYLNLENSGKELESIVVGEIQKSYNAYASILKREADSAYSTIEDLRLGPITMPKDTEWTSFIHRDERFVDPELPMRSAEFIQYPGRDHYTSQEIRAGLLERKSKYLKSYTAGWYVLSPTHLHEFKSADKTQAPVMSLYLPEQKLGSHSEEGGSSNKFVLKGRQTGSMHRGHTWVFRAESHDTMMAWYEDIKTLTERTPEERSNLVRGNGRSISRSSGRSSLSSDGVVDDDEDPPFMANAVSVNQQQLQQQQPRQDSLQRRPSGGRFPSDLTVNAQRGLQVPTSPISVASSYNEQQQQNRDHDVIAAAGALPGNHYDAFQQTYNSQNGQHAGSLVDSAYSNSNGSGGGGYKTHDGPVWAEPAPVHVPVHRNQAQTLSDRANTGIEQVYMEGIAQEVNGGGEEKKHRVAANRTDSGVPTLSHLHIPGEYPKGSNTGI
ncbi:putative 4,5-bisphosphate-binding protein [Podospora fimiseda]|uniref:4,5-bisphosphate-binding protein n=1 Tax=Podospora fimiseda TaxID=252190 RepID=A0AAN7H3H2_9PEZI|nr:putative 4,5-bisphosphate-binding protein [Podospora fimiseda]